MTPRALGLRLFWVVSTVMFLGGCVSFGPKAPTVLLTLTSASVTPGGTSRMGTPGDTIVILTPVTPAAIATTRIPVYDGATTLAYITDTAWNEAPARLFQRLVSETVASKTGRIVLDVRQASLDVGTRVSGQLVRLGVDPAAMQAVVVYDAYVTRARGIEQRRFEARVPIAAIEGRPVGVALNSGVNEVANQIAEWIK